MFKATNDQPEATREPEIKELSDQASIEQLELSPRTNNLLRRAGIDRIDELEDETTEELMSIHNFGPLALEEVVSVLEAHGKSLRTAEGGSMQ